MKATVFAGALVICGILIFVLFFRVLSLEHQVRNANEPNAAGIAALQESLKRVQVELAAAGTGRVHDNDPITCRETLVRHQASN